MPLQKTYTIFDFFHLLKFMIPNSVINDTGTIATRAIPQMQEPVSHFSPILSNWFIWSCVIMDALLFLKLS